MRLRSSEELDHHVADAYGESGEESLETVVASMRNTRLRKSRPLAELVGDKACIDSLTAVFRESGNPSNADAILVYGTLGSGKASIVASVARKENKSFYNVSFNTLRSGRIGDPTALVSAIFKDAKEHTPSVIFLGNIDLCFDEREHYSHAEGFRAEYTLLTEWSSLRSRSVGASHIIMVATSNQPWDFNESFIQIVDKTIRIPLPSTEDITKMFELYLAKLPSEDMNEDAMLFVCARLRHRNYTHQDVDLLLKGIRKIVRRDILDAKYFSKITRRGETFWQVCAYDDPSGKKTSSKKISAAGGKIVSRAVTLNDCKAAVDAGYQFSHSKTVLEKLDVFEIKSQRREDRKKEGVDVYQSE